MSALGLQELAAGSLLPRDSGVFEKVFSAALSRRVAARLLLVATLRTLWDPWRCPIEQLPHLAWAWSVDIWDENWPETKKRAVIADARRLHRLKTTLAGIRAHLKLVDCEIVKAVRPPARGWHTAAMRAADRAAWLADQPQIRIYPFATRAIAENRDFHSGPAGTSFIGRRHLRSGRGAALYGRRAALFDRGHETPVEVTCFTPPFGAPADRITFGRTGVRRLFHRAAWHGGGYLAASVAKRSVVTLRLVDEGFVTPVMPGAHLANIRPERIAQRRTAPAARAFFGRRGGFMLASQAPLLLYDRITLLDPVRLGARRKVKSWHGHGRFGIKPYCAELTVAVPMHRPKPRLARFHTGYLKAAGMEALERALHAIRVAKAARDTIHVSLTTHRVIRLADAPALGTFRLGQIIKIA